MNSTRIISFTLCLGLACLLMMGNALAGTTEVTAEVEYAREVGEAGAQYAIPAGTTYDIMRKLSILPSASFFVKISLDGNAEFDNEGPGELPDANDLTRTAGGGGNLTISVLGTPADGDTSVEYLVVAPTPGFDQLTGLYLCHRRLGNRRSRQCARWRRNHQRHCHDAIRQHRYNDRYRYRLRRVVERNLRCDRY